MLADAQAERVTRNQLGAGPMKDAARVATFAKLDHHLGEILRRASLAELVREEPRRASRRPIGEEPLVVAAFARDAVAHQQRRAQRHRPLGRRGVHQPLALDFLPAVEIDRRHGIPRGVGRGARAVENLFRRKMHKPCAHVMREPREHGGQRDVERLRERRIGVALLRHRDRGAVDDRLGKHIEHRGGHVTLALEVDRALRREPLDGTGKRTDGADHAMATARRRARKG